MRKTKKSKATTRVVTNEQVIEALEQIIRDHRAGKGDVLNRIAAGEDPHIDGGDPTIGTVLTMALFGRTAIEPRHSLTVNRAEYEALARIGAGSATKGAAIVTKTAHAWVKGDRSSLSAWLITALPALSCYFAEVTRVTETGMLSAEAWEVRIVNGPWGPALQSVLVSRDVLDGAGQEFMTLDVLRAMALAWNRKDFPGRAFAPVVRASVAA